MQTHSVAAIILMRLMPTMSVLRMSVLRMSVLTLSILTMSIPTMSVLLMGVLTMSVLIIRIVRMSKDKVIIQQENKMKLRILK